MIGIIGGKSGMGKYFVDFFERQNFSVLVSDKDTKLSNIQLAKQADVVIVAVPIGVTEAVIYEVAPHVKSSGLLMDITSLKVFPMKAMKSTSASYLGCHPMFGPTNSIEGQTVVLCKGKGAKWYGWWKHLLQKNQVDVREMTADKHDTVMAYVQVLTHLSNLALSDVIRKSELPISDLLETHSPIYRLRLDMMGRILHQNPDLYAQIQLKNPKSLRVIGDYLKSVEDWMSFVKNQDDAGFSKRFKSNAKHIGSFTQLAMEESDFLIEQLNRKRVSETATIQPPKPDASYDLAALGPEHTFSSLAAKKAFPKAKIYYAPSITSVFELVKKGVIKQGMVPIDNQLTGTVAETSRCLFDYNLTIQSQFRLPIHHSLSVLGGVKRSSIRTIYSHAQPFKQCHAYLKKHFPSAQLVSMPSTVQALNKVVSDNLLNAAVISSAEAANAYQMTVLEANIEDFSFNSTRFLVIGKKPLRKKARFTNQTFVTSIVFHFSSDAAGSLNAVLNEFALAKVNMTKIESQVNPQVPGGHLFYIDFEGHSDDAKVKKCLVKLSVWSAS
ncbi:prephenate dehydrogenase/arogenate dehydrogenase family protein [Candidatus Peregrinibacteria bacterium]|nr:MAG: prephenate dehydrogenase/arogenate dehydrogenase family protein [Candidatus Peregrinibacteria bacterium]